MARTLMEDAQALIKAGYRPKKFGELTNPTKAIKRIMKRTGLTKS